MKILFIVTSFNGMSQRLWLELDRRNHQVKVLQPFSTTKLEEATDEYKPDLIIAPYLKTSIPENIWKNYTCLVVHPGIAGDRGASSLDWAILHNEKEWGVTVLQAEKKMDAGPVWATAAFPMRSVSKSQLYRHEVTQAATEALLEAVERFEHKKFVPQKAAEMNGIARGKWNRSTTENDFRFYWEEDAADITRKINAADSYPGASCIILNEDFLAYGAVEEKLLKGVPGQVLAQRDGAICVAAGNGSLWIRCLRKKEAGTIKLPAMMTLGESAKEIPESARGIFDKSTEKTFHEIWYHEANDVGYLHFDFYNGAMSTAQCWRLLNAFKQVKLRPAKVIVLMGGEDVWSNGIHLNVIEASDDPAAASWENINALNDLIREIICTDTHFIISALQGNAGAGGVAMALAADKVVAKKGIVFNPHTRNMGLYGSEYWTYLLPRRIGTQRAVQFTEQCLPWGTAIALEVKLIDDCLPKEIPPSENLHTSFMREVKELAEEIATLPYFPQLLTAKKFKRKRDEGYKPLEKYREEELSQMHGNFFNDNWGYDEKRFRFVHKINAENDPGDKAAVDLFSERRKIWRRRKQENLFYET